MFFPTEEHLERAKKLLAAGDEASLRYCCLELRFCIEFLAYERLDLHEGKIPEDFDKWQPKDVVELLVDIDPDAEKDYEVAIAIHKPGEMPPMSTFQHYGSFKAVTRKFIREHYHKLGSFLHAPTLGQIRSGNTSKPKAVRAFVEETLRKIEKLCSTSFLGTMAPVASFPCHDCGKTVARNVASIRRDGIVTCVNPTCKAQYTVTDLDSPTPMFKLVEVSFDCPACGSKTFVGKHRLTHGIRVTCSHCPQQIRFNRGWIMTVAPRSSTPSK